MFILGLNVYHGDSSACIYRDDELLCAFEEERFTRKKHWSGFPVLAIKECLKEAGISIEQVDHITVSRNPREHFAKKVMHALKYRFSLNSLKQRYSNSKRAGSLENDFSEHFGMPVSFFKSRIHNIEHHRSHLASAFFASPFDEAAILSIDAFGDFCSTMLAVGKGNKIKVLESVLFPHSVGIFYTAFTQYLGFRYYGDEYKVMGLAPYGKPVYLKEMESILKLEPDGLFTLDLDCFVHQSKGIVTRIFEDNDPTPSQIYSEKLVALFGPARQKDEPLTEHHRNLASSVQRHCELAIFHLLHRLHKLTGIDNLCVAGGVAQNSVANGKIKNNTPFRNVYIPPAGHDAGTSIGSALYLMNHELDMPRTKPMFNPYTGSKFSNDEIRELLKKEGVPFTEVHDKLLYDKVSKCLIGGGIVGWFQGRAEFGPRALGHRSILADPRRNDVKEILNLKIKRRESFRPFAPSILMDHIPQYFETVDYVPFMEKVFVIKPEMREAIPAVTHVDGTGRLQSVDRNIDEKYYDLIHHFYTLTGVPVLVNTSFNENEPIVNSPREALDCFLRTKMDMLVLENCVVER
ncbi:MAG: carbamoyltransferase C-terminal domain-containing protein [Chitinophagaceae bacterium]